MRPVADDISETVLTPDCKDQTGLHDDDIKNAQTLENVLEEVFMTIRFICLHHNHYTDLTLVMLIDNYR